MLAISMKPFSPSGCGLLALFVFSSSVFAESTILNPVADTTIHEFFPGNNFGNLTHVAAGTIRDQDGEIPRNRGLFKFDLSTIPPSANITSAKLTLNISFVPPGGASSSFGLYRVTKAWGEGDKTGNGGQSAEEGEASWFYSDFPNEWDNLGGDYTPAASGIAATGTTTGPIIWRTQGMVDDVRFWLVNPGSNFGWLLKSEAEGVEQTTKRWGSKESTTPPKLELQWSVDLPTELRITDVRSTGSSITLFYSGAARVMVQMRPSLGEPWQTLPTEFTASPITLPTTGTMGFYRLISTP